MSSLSGEVTVKGKRSSYFKKKMCFLRVVLSYLIDNTLILFSKFTKVAWCLFVYLCIYCCFNFT